jgi:branched-chain amino acid transport system substrate-binding protein
VDLTQPAVGYPNSPDRYQPSGSPNFARTVPADDVVVDAAADWASELEATNAAVTSDGSAFQNLAALEFKTAAAAHGIQVMPGKPPSEVAVSAHTGKQAVYQPGSQRLSLYGSAPGTFSVSAELEPSRLPGQDFASRFEQRFHRPPGPYAAYGYEAMGLVLQAIRGAGTDASSFRDNVRNGVFGAHRDGTVLGSYAITSEGDTTECAIQRYRISGDTRRALSAPCPPH